MNDSASSEPQQSNAERFMDIIGKAMPAPMTEQERAEYDTWNAEAETQADQIFGSSRY